MGKTLKINREADQIAKYSFIGADDLQTVIIPSTVSKIAANTFSDCKSLKAIYCEFGEDTILGAPWGAPAGCEVYYNCYYENPVPVGGGDSTGGIDTSDATATAGHILYPATAYANGKKITGNIQTVKASASGNTVTVPKGYIEKEQSFTIESSDTGTDISDATVTADAMLAGYIGYNADGSRHVGNIPTVTASRSANTVTVPKGFVAEKQTLTIPAVTPTLADNVVTVPEGYIAEKKTLTVAEMAEPSLSANVVTIGKGYNKTQKTVTVPEAGELTVTDNVVTVPIGYIKTQRTATVPAAAAPTTSGNVVTVNKGYQAAQKKITVGTSVSAKTYTPGTADQTIAAGSYLTGKQTIKGDANLDGANIRAGKTLFGKAGTFSADATATAADILDGKTAAINGEMVTGTLKASSGSGSSAAFYLATDIQGGLEKITVTGGCFHDDMGEPASLAGEYTLVDKGCFGMDRVWYCPATTAQTVDGTDYASISGACIGCADFEWGYDDNDNIVYKKMWCISYGKTPDSYSNYFQDSDSGEKPSPFGITWETGGAAWEVTTPPVLTADVEDAEPYGPSSWAGKQMTWQERTIYVSYGAGVEDANGVWYRNDEGTPMSLNTVFFNFNGRARIVLIADGSRYRWVFRIDGYGDQWVYYVTSQCSADNIPNPFDPEEVSWTHGSSEYKPVPTLTFGEKGYYPSDSETTGLPMVKAAPQIGRIYNDDATVRIGAMYPAK